LSWIKTRRLGELRFVQEHTHQRAVRNQRRKTTQSLLTGCDGEAMVMASSHMPALAIYPNKRAEAARRACVLPVSAPFKTLHFYEKHRPKAQGRFISPHHEGLDTRVWVSSPTS